MVAVAAATASAHLVTAPQSVTSVTGPHMPTKINKPPVLPVGAQKVCTEEAVHSTIVRSV